jgi:hypothetical protein
MNWNVSVAFEVRSAYRWVETLQAGAPKLPDGRLFVMPHVKTKYQGLMEFPRSCAQAVGRLK